MGTDDGDPRAHRTPVRQAYRTPLTVFSTHDGVAVLLTYGPDRDWLKNVTAAGGGTMRRYGRSFRVTDPR